MTDANASVKSISFFAVLNILLKRWRILATSMGLGVTVAAVFAFTTPAQYRSEATVLIATGESGELSQLRGLASQFGITTTASRNTDLSPDLLVRLVVAPVLLKPLVHESFNINFQAGDREPLINLLAVASEGAGADDAVNREIEAIRTLRSLIVANVDKKTNAITLAVLMPAKHLSHEVLERLIDELDRYLFSLGQRRAAAERRAMDERIGAQEKLLNTAEAKIAEFLKQNRVYQTAPDLQFEYERMQRDVMIQQQVLTGMTMSRIQAASRETMAMPSLTVLEPPSHPIAAEPRGRLRLLTLGLMIALLLSATVVLVLAWTNELMQSNTQDARDFQQVIRHIFRRQPPTNS
jgi:uncharacterized protein involved in exopolysaccharide biosynthesis